MGLDVEKKLEKVEIILTEGYFLGIYFTPGISGSFAQTLVAQDIQENLFPLFLRCITSGSMKRAPN